MEGMEGVVQCRTLLGFPVGGTEEHPLLRGGHLGADLGVALVLEPHCHPVQLVAELPEVLVLPDGFVLPRGEIQDTFYVRVVLSEQLLDVLLDCWGRDNC